MAETRRSLTEGIPVTQPNDDGIEKAFVYGAPNPNRLANTNHAPPASNRVQLSTRLREDLFKSLKHASLERQMDGVQPCTIVEILEAALEPWLKSNGYLS